MHGDDEDADDEETPLLELSNENFPLVPNYSFWSSSRKDKALILVLGSVDLTTYMCISILAPFFPETAKEKNVSSLLAGWIFAVHALVMFMASPFFGKSIELLGMRFMLIAGQFFAAGCTMLFGLLSFIPTTYDRGTTFVILCFLLRILAALGSTASATASFTITANSFPNNVGSVFGFLETCTGLGMMLGPPLGGFLYQIWGFPLPFIVLGGLMMLTVPLIIAVVTPTSNDVFLSGQSCSMTDLLKLPSVIVTCISIMMASFIYSYPEPVFESRLAEFDINPGIIGLIFLLESASYALPAPLWGWISDTTNGGSIMMCLGFFLATVGFVLIGPSPLIPFLANVRELWLNIVAVMILGISCSLALVPTFEKILIDAEQKGYASNVKLYGLVAGLWGCSSSFGEFFGPVLAGWLVGKFGFASGMNMPALGCFLMFLFLTSFTIYNRCTNRNRVVSL